MVQWVSNLPDGEHTPYKFLAAQPHIKSVVSYLRPSDYLQWTAITVGFPGIFYVWGKAFNLEQYRPTLHPKSLPKAMAIQVPFFAACGFLHVCRNSYCKMV